MVQEMRDDRMRSTIEGYRAANSLKRQRQINLRLSFVWGVAGITIGLTIEGWIYRHYAARAVGITAVIEIGLMIISLAILTAGGFALREWKRELQCEREEVVARTRADIDRMYGDDVVGAARMKMQLEEQWPLP